MPVTSNRKSKPLLIVEDDETTSNLVALLLSQEGIATHRCERIADAKLLNPEGFDLAIIDLGLPDGDGTELLHHFHRHCPEMPLLVLTACDRARSAIEAIHAGACDYLTKPFDRAELLESIYRARAASRRGQSEAVTVPATQARQKSDPVAESYPSPAMRQVAKMETRAARSDVPVLITGETGCGKGVMAREIHRLSTRADGPLQLVTCPAIPKELAEAELFGHEKGSFTGAVGTRKGRIEAAHGGTLFLDEIGDLQLSIQPKLLEVLQSGTFNRVGGTSLLHSDFRLISATNVGLWKCVEEKTFREDLLFRINLFEIRIPALRERTKDLPLLSHSILERLDPPENRPTWEIEPELMRWFSSYHWPGNIRQLENVLGRMTLLASGNVLRMADLPMSSLQGSDGPLLPEDMRAALGRGQALEDIERAALVAALEGSGGNRKRAARTLGVSLRTVYNMIDRFGLPKRLTGPRQEGNTG